MSSSAAAIRPADGERRLTSAMRWRPGRREALDERPRAATRRAVGDAARPRARPRSARRARRSRRRRRRSRSRPASLRRAVSRRSRGRSRGRRAASAAVARPAVAPAARRAARRRSSAPPARCRPRAVDRARGDERRAGVEQDDVAPRPGLAARIASMIAAFSAAVAAGERRGRRRRRPSASASIVRRSTPAVGHVVEHAAAVERQLVDAGRRGRPTSAPCRGAGRPRRSGRRAADRRRRTARGVAPAGFVSGPMRLNAVRTPISRRVGPACFIAGWKFGREQEREPELAQRRAGGRRRRGRSGRRARRARRPSPPAT